jgi:hypothetical protein
MAVSSSIAERLCENCEQSSEFHDSVCIFTVGQKHKHRLPSFPAFRVMLRRITFHYRDHEDVTMYTGFARDCLDLEEPTPTTSSFNLFTLQFAAWTARPSPAEANINRLHDKLWTDGLLFSSPGPRLLLTILIGFMGVKSVGVPLGRLLVLCKLSSREEAAICNLSHCHKLVT